MLQRSRKLNIPLDLVSDLFDTLVTPVLLYGCEIYAPYKYKSIENVNLRFCKYILGVNASTKNVMAYGETGSKPLHIQVKTRTVSFWNKLTTGSKTKQILNDQYSEEWDQEVHESPKCLNYRIFKTKIELES